MDCKCTEMNECNLQKCVDEFFESPRFKAYAHEKLKEYLDEKCKKRNTENSCDVTEINLSFHKI